MATPSTPHNAAPLFDLFLDLPHPAGSPSCPPPFTIGPPGESKVTKELVEEQSVARIIRFAFPEHEDRIYAQEVEQKKNQRQEELALGGGGAGHNRFDFYAHHVVGFQHHSFALQLSNGTRVHGHVRRYLPPNPNAKTRYDVGRRGIRALVVLTRAQGGERFYASIIKTVEAISSQQAATPAELHPSGTPQQGFLHALYRQHERLSIEYAKQQGKAETSNNPRMLSVGGAEFGNTPNFVPVDANHFHVPAALFQPSEVAATRWLLLPLLRCLGVPNTLRIMSAVLCERRIIMVSANPSRLSVCCKGAISILSQGMMHWQHLFIPVLPPHLIQYLAAPMPYVVGVLSNIAGMINHVQGIGEVLIVNLDQNSMEMRGVSPHLVASIIPDLLRATPADGSQQYLTVSEILAQDLVEITKVDKKATTGEVHVQDRVNQVAGKATDVMKKTFGKLKDRFQQRTITPQESLVSEESFEDEKPSHTVPTPYFLGEGYENEVSEEEARIAFTNFFLCLLGEMRWYLSVPGPGQAPVLDKKKFLDSRRASGDGEGTPLYPVLTHFVESQIFEQFVKARVEEVQKRIAIAEDAPLFLRCANYHRLHRIEFSISDVRRVSRQVSEQNPSRFLLQWNSNARRQTLALTSAKGTEADARAMLATLTEQCREASTVLSDVMTVLWDRLNDCKGMRWKHAILGLKVIQNLVLHGPLAAVAEARDGLDRIRALKNYSDNMRGQNNHQVRLMASEVYTLLVDLSTLFTRRRTSANLRRLVRNPPKRTLIKETRLMVTVPFKQMHPFLKPGTYNAAPSRAATAPTIRPQPPPQVTRAPSADLLSLGAPTPTPAAPVPQSQKTDDLLDIFSQPATSQTVSAPPAATSNTLAPSSQAGAVLSIAEPPLGNPVRPAAPQMVSFRAKDTPSFALPPTNHPIGSSAPNVAPPPQAGMHPNYGRPGAAPTALVPSSQPVHPTAPATPKPAAVPGIPLPVGTAQVLQTGAPAPQYIQKPVTRPSQPMYGGQLSPQGNAPQAPQQGITPAYTPQAARQPQNAYQYQHAGASNSQKQSNLHRFDPMAGR